MKANEINYMALRVLDRVWAPIAATHEMASEADAKFDGGEWSDPANARTGERLFIETCERVGAHYNIPGERLAHMYELAANIQQDRTVDTICAQRR